VNKQTVAAIVLAVFLGAGADAQTADLFELAKTGTPLSLKAAIDQGANVNVLDPNGLTPLMWAAQYNQNADMIATLLKAGADLDAQNKDGVTSLMYAAMHNTNPVVIDALLESGADVH